MLVDFASTSNHNFGMSPFFSMCIYNLNIMLSRKGNNDALISQICINLLYLEILSPIPYHSLQEKSRNLYPGYREI